MVDGLSERLATQGGTAAEWAQLIGALGVLGETERAQAIFDEALSTFAGDEAALERIRAAAAQAGLEG
jgi:cytochrome c-type biogenesis protein CcmH